MSNRFAAFLAGEMGLTILDLFEHTKDALKLAVLDKKNFHNKNQELLNRLNSFSDTAVIYWDELRTEQGYAMLERLSIDLGIMASWGYRIEEPLLSLTRLGYLNGHPSYLPFCRGKHPHFWCIQDNTPCGGTLHLIDANLDTGPILWQKEVPYDWTDTGKSLYKKSWSAVQELLAENWDSILALDFPQYRPNAEGKYHFGKELGTVTEIDLDEKYTARELLNLLRGRTFPPYPAAYFSDSGSTYEVRVEITKKSDNSPNLT